MEKIDLGWKVSTEELLEALGKAARGYGGAEFNPDKGFFGGEKVIVLGSAHEEMRGHAVVYYPEIRIPFKAFMGPFFQATHIVLSFRDQHFHEETRSFVGHIHEGRDYKTVEMNVSVVGKKTCFAKWLSRSLLCVPVIGWVLLRFLYITLFEMEHYQREFPEKFQDAVKPVYMEYLSKVGDILKAHNAEPETA